MQYRYVAYSLAEGLVKGKVEARDENDARADLVHRGYKPLRVKKPPQLSIDKLLASLDQVKPKEVLAFARQMATMLASGATLLRALEMSQGEGASKPMIRVLQRIHERVGDGESMTVALREHKKVFDDVSISLVEVGEHTRRLGPALDELVNIMEQSAEAKARAVKAMMMPMFLIGTSLLMLGFMAFVAFPPLINTFEDMGVEIPLMTNILIKGTKGLVANIKVIGASLFGIFVVYKLLGRFPYTNYWLDQAKARTPILGGVLKAGELGQFTRVLATLLGAGVDLPSSLRLATTVSKNSAIRRAWTDADESLIAGHRMVEALQRHSILPQTFVELLAIGEESNTLPDVAETLAGAYEKQFEDKIGALLAVLEPVSTFAVGGLVLFMALSVLKPILSAANEV